MARYFDLPFTAKARRELRRAAAKNPMEYTVTDGKNMMTVTANDTGDAKRKANRDWHGRFGYKPEYFKLKVHKLDAKA